MIKDETELADASDYRVYVFPAELLDENGDRRSLVWNPETQLGKSLKQLDALHNEMHSARYNAQYMNDVSLMEGVLIGAGDIQHYHTEIRLNDYNIFTGLDLAVSEEDWADQTAIIHIAQHKIEPHIKVLPYVFERMTFNACKERILAECAKWKPLRIGVESNAYQLAMFQELVRVSHYPFVKIHRSKDSYSRAYEIASFFERGQIQLRPDQIELEEQLLKLAPGGSDQDDLTDALHAALVVRTDVPPEARIRNL